VLRRGLAITLILPLAAFPFAKKQKGPQQKEVKVQKTSLSRDQELQIGKQAAAEVERTLEVVQNPEVEAWLNHIGQQLAKQPQANAYPYYFKLVNDESVNAFALPGGPMYVHTGLIKAADDESQVAGVLAHEMSHVALRHGAAQMSKAQTWQTIAGLAGAAAGMTGSGILTEAVQMGGGIGVGSLLSKFSRGYEQDADLNGARMMASAGYNPLDLAVFFEKLEAQMGTAASPKGLEKFFADHPAPGRRRDYIEQDITFYPKKTYNAAAGDFAKVQHAVGTIPPPKKKPAASLSPVQPKPREGVPQGFRDLQTKGFAVAYPGDWKTGQAKSGSTIYIVPEGGVVQQPSGGVELIAGAMIDYYQLHGGSTNLQAATSEYLQSLKQGDQNMHVDNTQSTQVGGKPALVTKLTTRTSFQQDPNQVVYLYTVAREEGLWNLALAAPQSKWSEAEPVLQQIAKTVQFPD
jgi:beta-barrel assembly-enhancing protease